MFAQICSSLEPRQVSGQLLPGVGASRERRPALYLSHVLLPEGQAEYVLPHWPGSGKKTGQISSRAHKMWSVLLWSF